MLNYILLQQTADAGGVMNIIMIVVLVAIFYFFMIRPQQKRQKEMRKFRENITEGQRVVTAGGIYGKVRKVKGNAFVVEVAPNVNITIDKNSVYPSAEEALTDGDTETKKQ